MNNTKYKFIMKLLSILILIVFLYIINRECVFINENDKVFTDFIYILKKIFIPYHFNKNTDLYITEILIQNLQNKNITY